MEALRWQRVAGPHKEREMTRFVIEREIPGAKDLTQDQLAEIAQTSNEAVASLGVPYTCLLYTSDAADE